MAHVGLVFQLPDTSEGNLIQGLFRLVKFDGGLGSPSQRTWSFAFSKASLVCVPVH